MTDPKTLIADHVASFNEGVSSGDFTEMMARFHPEARLEFRGVPAGPFEGVTAIAEAYRAQPPDDAIDVLDVDERSGAVYVSYAWRKHRGQRAGDMIFRIDDGRITELVVTFDP